MAAQLCSSWEESFPIQKWMSWERRLPALRVWDVARDQVRDQLASPLLLPAGMGRTQHTVAPDLSLPAVAPKRTYCVAQAQAARIPLHIWEKLTAYCSQINGVQQGPFPTWIADLPCGSSIPLNLQSWHNADLSILWLSALFMWDVVSSTRMSTSRPAFIWPSSTPL